MRVIALVDMDCFYCQVEEKLNPELQGKPVAVVQYNLWREGGIIAANYLAKEKGVTKGMWKHEAKDLCPEIQFARVAELRGRADLTKYREAGGQVVDVLSSFPVILERASIDEAYLDLTEAVKNELAKGISNIPLEKLRTTHIVGHTTAGFITSISSDQDTDGLCEDDLKLAIGGIIVEKMRSSIYEKTGYRCSAGIAQNKILAKLVCGLHKPNKQTILPGNAIPQFLSELPLKKIKRLGGKFGNKISEELSVTMVGQLLKFSQEELSRKFDSKVGLWLYNIARGIDNEPVAPKLLSKSISCCKRFPGKNALIYLKDIEHWINELAVEVAQRLIIDQEEHSRKAKMITLSYVQCVNSKDVNASKTFTLKSYESSVIAGDAFEILKKVCHKTNSLYHVKYLGISVGTFENLKNIKNIKTFFQQKRKDSKSNETGNLLKGEDDEMKVKSEGVKEPANLIPVNQANFQAVVVEEKSEEISKASYLIPKEEIKEILDSKTNDITSNEKENDAHLKSKTEKQNGSLCDLSEEEEEISESELEKSFFVRYFNQLAKEKIKDSTHEIPHTENVKETCKECGMLIDFDDIISHKDYHFALKLHKEYSSPNSKNSRIDSNQSSKRRKIKEYEKTPIFTGLYEEACAEEKEMCELCKKYISISDLLSHSDYHTAKNLEKMWKAEDSDSKRRNNEKSGGSILRYFERKTSVL